MTRIHFFLVAVGALATSCNTPSTKNAEVETPSKAAQTTNCYRAVVNQDTITMRLTTADSLVTGDLAYHFHEKDRNEGTIQGRLTGDLLIADYSFQSEGVVSIRQVAFRKKEGGFVEGYGDTEERDGRMSFKNVQSLDFSHGPMLKEVPCTE